MFYHVTLDKYSKQILLHLYYAAMIDEYRIGAVLLSLWSNFNFDHPIVKS